MRSIGFGLERVAWPAMKWPRAVSAVVAVVLAVALFGITRIAFDENLRSVFASSEPAYATYVAATEAFVDPENEILVLVEGDGLGAPANFKRLQDFQFELQFVDGVGSVYSAFALRDPPGASGNPPLVVRDASLGLTPELLARIRGHPLLGAKLLSADGKAMVYVVTPSQAKAPLSVARAQQTAIERAAAKVLAGSGLNVTVAGFPILRAAIVDVVRRDQIVLNLIGAAIGFAMSLLAFRSITAAVLTAVPGIAAGIVVLGVMGIFGLPVTVLSNVVPALVMILGYADAMHLSHAWRRHRERGLSPHEAEWRAQGDVAAACMLTALTVSGAFLALAITDIGLVRNFAFLGAFAMVIGCATVLVVHAVGAIAIGRFWRLRAGGGKDVLEAMEGPSSALGRLVVAYARPIAVLSAVLFVTFGAMYLSVPPEHSIREHLPSANVANAALARFDQNFGGAYPVAVLVPLNGLDPTSPEALARIGAVHRAVATLPGVYTPLSLWSLVEWLGGGPDVATSARLETILAAIDGETASRLFSANGTALLTVSTKEAPSQAVARLVGDIEAAAARAMGGGVVPTVTGVTVITAREAARTINNLNGSLSLAIVGDILLMIVAFRNVPIGVVSVIANTLPLFAVGALLFVLGHGFQLTTVVALTVAFGIAVDDTIHYINRFLILGRAVERLGERLVRTAGEVGPVLVATTAIVITGLLTTLTSGLPTVQLFGMIATITLIVAVIGDLVVMPALIAGFGKRWFESKRKMALSPAASEP
jgi:predicted RND superfamily exporter protein